MCTVTFYKNRVGAAILTSNRDEKVHRPTIPPTAYAIGKTNTIYPKDEVAEGTWIALADSQTIYCLLNGGFKKHVSTGDYKKSRGLIILDLIKQGDFNSFYNAYDFLGLEPFTLIVFENEKLYELKWDGTTKFLKFLEPKGHYIWSSATLYNEEEAELKKSWFDLLFSKQRPSEQAVFKIHNSSASEKGFLLEKDDLTRTVSISQLMVSNEIGTFNYLDLLNSKEQKLALIPSNKMTIH